MKKIQKKILVVILSAIVAFSMPTALAVDAYYNLPLDTGNHHRYSGGSRSRSRSRSNSRSPVSYTHLTLPTNSRV